MDQYGANELGQNLVGIILPNLCKYWHFNPYSLVEKLEPHTIMRRQATYFLISMIISFCIGVLIDILPDLFGIGLFPKITIIFLIGPILFLFLSLKNSVYFLKEAKP